VLAIFGYNSVRSDRVECSGGSAVVSQDRELRCGKLVVIQLDQTEQYIVESQLSSGKTEWIAVQWIVYGTRSSVARDRVECSGNAGCRLARQRVALCIVGGSSVVLDRAVRSSKAAVVSQDRVDS
jgi:hypothetical protein